ncbi:MAG: peptidase [Microcoleaceae cyanobacterium]
METAFDQFWKLVFGALSLNPEAFIKINVLPLGTKAALAIVLMAGLAQAIGQCVVLFINRVKPFRFLLSLGIASFLFLAAFGFWAGSVWLVANFILRIPVDWITIHRTLGLSYAPLLLGFLIALPYLGVPISVMLSIWALLAEITGLKTVSGMDEWQAFVCSGLGWFVFQALERTVGQPVTQLGNWIANTVAGTQLVRDEEGLEEIVMQGNPPTVDSVSREILAEANATSDIRKISGVQFFGIALAVFAIVVLFAPGTQDRIFTWYVALGETLRVIVKLLCIALLALLFSILLTPLESLWWWAGWNQGSALKYPPGEPVRPVDDPKNVARYILYLDGINQGTGQYVPIVENFLQTLANALPSNMLVVQGIMPYSVDNRGLDEDRPLAFLWRYITKMGLKSASNPLGFFVNLRNVFAVAVSADARYGPLQNQGLAQVLFSSLIRFGYPLGSGVPVTVIGYSGGGQMSMGSVTALKRSLGNTPVDVISLEGVIAGNTGAMCADHLYHLIGDNDQVQKIGPIFFPGRWPISVLSNWNCARRRGKITLISLGPVGHTGPKGPMSDTYELPDGRTALEQTVDVMTGILTGDWSVTGLDPDDFQTASNYERYQAGLFNQSSYYPLQVEINSQFYRPIGNWVGRLILPPEEKRAELQGVWLEIHHADPQHQHRIGQIAILRWSDLESVNNYVKLVTVDVEFIDQAYASEKQGNIHPDRVNRWPQVDPLESLAGARPEDDIVVRLPDPVVIEDNGSSATVLYIKRDPIQISGRFYAVVKFVQFLGGDLFAVRHYNRISRKFNGPEEVVYVPSVIASREGVLPATNQGLEKSPVNSTGWYIYGSKNHQDQFVVQALAPFKLFSLQPDRVIKGKKATVNFINFHAWDNTVDNKGHAYSTLLDPTEVDPDEPELEQPEHWREGDRALLMHVFGGRGGQHGEFAPLGMYFGHFAFGIAQVIYDPLIDDLRFEIEYRQIYTHNSGGLTSGSLAWMRYMGDRQWGWLGTRPVADMLIRFSPLLDDYNFGGIRFSPLSYVMRELDVMAARYRTGDGTGTTVVSSVNSCVQDSSQALYSALRRMIAEFQVNPLILRWLREHPDHEQTQRFSLLSDLVDSLESYLLPFDKARADWRYNIPTLGYSPVETPAQTLKKTIASWETLLPRWTADQIAMIFLQLGASLWVLRTNQVGGDNPDIEPIAPTDFGWAVPKIKRVKRVF